MRLLIIEDFGTTGLKGAVDVKDNGQFCGFWRRFGRSNKKQAQGGRWGLGKLVFPSASQVRTVVGLTRRADDASSWLMGQAILRNHQIGGIEKDSVGFWCDANAARKGMPTSDPALCRAGPGVLHRAHILGSPWCGGWCAPTASRAATRQ